jgi:hypothetical protein
MQGTNLDDFLQEVQALLHAAHTLTYADVC